MTLGGHKKPAGGRLGKRKASPGVKSEKSTANALGWSQTKGSGNYQGDKGDLRPRSFETFLGENKATKHASYALKLSVLWKIAREARESRRAAPLLVVDFENAEGSFPKKWAVIPLENFNELLEQAGVK